MKVDIVQIKQRFGIVGTNPGLERAIMVAAQVAPTDLSVLVTGESGVGKEFFPQIIHHLSVRKHNTYIAVNCGAIPEGTIDSELFGHKKGSFTGALADRKGYFEEADGGTIFLDEVGELPLATQARLLRVLENGEFIPVGSSKAQKTDVRVVAATNVDITDAVRRGRFREDLYFRLNTVPIHVPPLRERKEDIPLLFRLFAARNAEKYRIPQIELAPDAAQLLLSYSWPGNIRELRNVAEQLGILERDRTITAPILEHYLKDDGLKDLHPVVIDDRGGDGHSFASEREILYRVLFEMRRDITDLRRVVHDLSHGMASISDPSVSASSHHTASAEVSRADSPPMVPAVFGGLSVASPAATPHVADVNEIEDAEESLSLREAERRHILAVLKKHGGNRKNAAEELEISDRTLYRKLKEYGE